MNGISWSFRDLANHLFPGIIISFPIFYIVNAEIDITYDVGAAVIFAFLILSYIIGFSVDSISKINRWANKAIRLFRVDPLRNVFVKYDLRKEISDPKTFEGIALQLIQKKFGRTLLKNEYRLAIIYYMLREIESKNAFLANFISRISALENMCRNIGLACLINFLIIYTYTIYLDIVSIILISLFLLTAIISLFVSRNDYRNWLRSVVKKQIAAGNSYRSLLLTLISMINVIEGMRRNISIACHIAFLFLIACTIFLGKIIGVILPLFFLISGILLLIARDDNRDWFGKVVIRGFVAVNSESFPLTGFPDAELSEAGGSISGSTPPVENSMISSQLQAGGDDKSPPSDT
ncbi:MAG: hypothetical protein ACXIVD_01715 [Salinarimonas sp.]